MPWKIVPKASSMLEHIPSPLLLRFHVKENFQIFWWHLWAFNEDYKVHRDLNDGTVNPSTHCLCQFEHNGIERRSRGFSTVRERKETCLWRLQFDEEVAIWKTSKFATGITYYLIQLFTYFPKFLPVIPSVLGYVTNLAIPACNKGNQSTERKRGPGGIGEMRKDEREEERELEPQAMPRVFWVVVFFLLRLLEGLEESELKLRFDLDLELAESKLIVYFNLNKLGSRGDLQNFQPLRERKETCLRRLKESRFEWSGNWASAFILILGAHRNRPSPRACLRSPRTHISSCATSYYKLINYIWI